ncbi:MAG TPA: c-type cytochrome [Gemmatimonadales bacterium]
MGWLVVALASCRQAQRTAPPAATPGALLTAPDGAPLPSGPLGLSILRGHALMVATRDSLPGHVGGNLRCVSCHLRDGRDSAALPLTGVYARFPQYRARAGQVEQIEDRVNDCFVRSLNGTPLVNDDPAMRDIVAYLAFLSHGVPVASPIARTAASAAVVGDTTKGLAVFQSECARCHGSNGAGQAGYPALWGTSSFNIGAGMARPRTLAVFVRANMPYDDPGVLDETAARDVAAYITSRSRPDLPGKENDWPNGGAPPDLRYRTNHTP